MTWKIIRVLEGRCLFGIHLHVKERFSVKLLADLILFTQPSAMCETAAGKVSAQPHTIVKQICFPNGNVLFLSLFSLFKN